MLVYFIAWIVLSLLVAQAGSKRKIGFNTSLLLSVLLSPLVGLIAVFLSERQNSVSLNTMSITNWREDLDTAEREEVIGNIESALKHYKLAFHEYLKVTPAKVAQGSYEVRRKELEQKIKELERSL